MACIPISFPPSAPMPKLEPSSRLPNLGSYPTYHPSPNGVHKKKQFASLPYRTKGSIAHLPPREQIVQLRQSRKAIKGKLYSRIARLQRELDVLQREYYADPADDYTPLARAPRFWPEDHAARPRDLFAHDAQPQGAYYGSRADRSPPPRMTRFDAPNDEILLYTSASCLDQHTASGTRSAASACVFGPAGLQPRSVALRLERRGPTGQEHPQEANRAHLRAAIAALQCRQWREEGWSAITIASDSEYLVEGITNWIEIWQQNGWRTSKSTGNSYEGGMVANRDLWELLLLLLIDHEQMGVEVRFWLILHELNLEAHAEARTAAEVLKEEENFCRVPYIEEIRSAENTRHAQEGPFYTGFARLPQ